MQYKKYRTIEDKTNFQKSKITKNKTLSLGIIFLFFHMQTHNTSYNPLFYIALHIIIIIIHIVSRNIVYYTTSKT